MSAATIFKNASSSGDIAASQLLRSLSEGLANASRRTV